MPTFTLGTFKCRIKGSKIWTVIQVKTPIDWENFWKLMSFHQYSAVVFFPSN